MNGIPKQPEAWQPLEQAVPADLFRAEVRAWAERIGVEPREIHLRPMKRKWASCSSRGRLTFDTGLLRQPADKRAEVGDRPRVAAPQSARSQMSVSGTVEELLVKKVVSS